MIFILIVIKTDLRQTVGIIDSHVHGTRPNAVSAFRRVYPLRAHELNTITFTHLTQLHITILRAVLRVLGEPTQTY
jgi:hypothetical protein